MESAATVALVLLVVLWLFQIALATGAPWGAAAWGGRHVGVLPMRLRIASAIAALLLYPLIALYIATAGALLPASTLPGAGKPAMWILTGFFALGTVMNLASRSKIERIWAPVALALAVCCAVIALRTG